MQIKRVWIEPEITELNIDDTASGGNEVADGAGLSDASGS